MGSNDFWSMGKRGFFRFLIALQGFTELFWTSEFHILGDVQLSQRKTNGPECTPALDGSQDLRLLRCCSPVILKPEGQQESPALLVVLCQVSDSAGLWGNARICLTWVLGDADAPRQETDFEKFYSLM